MTRPRSGLRRRIGVLATAFVLAVAGLIADGSLFLQHWVTGP